MTLHGLRSRDKVGIVYSRSPERARRSRELGHPARRRTCRRRSSDPDSEIVVVGLPNHLHKEAVRLAAEAGKAVLCTKPLARNAAEAAAHARGRREGRRLRRLPRGPRLHAQDPQGPRIGRRGRLGQGPLGALAGDPSRPAQRLVLGPRSPGAERSSTWAATASRSAAASSARTSGRSRSSAGATPRSTRSTPRTTPSGSSGTRTGRSASSRSAGPSAAGWTSATRSPGPRARSGSTISCAPASRCSRPRRRAATWPRRPRPTAGWLFPVGDEVHELGYVHMFTDMLDALEPGRRPARRSTTAMSSTPSSTPATAPRRAAAGSPSTSSSGAAGRPPGSRRHPSSTTGSSSSSANSSPTGATAHPQGPGKRRLPRSRRRGRVTLLLDVVPAAASARPRRRRAGRSARRRDRGSPRAATGDTPAPAYARLVTMALEARCRSPGRGDPAQRARWPAARRPPPTPGCGASCSIACRRLPARSTRSPSTSSTRPTPRWPTTRWRRAASTSPCSGSGRTGAWASTSRARARCHDAGGPARGIVAPGGRRGTARPATERRVTLGFDRLLAATEAWLPSPAPAKPVSSPAPSRRPTVPTAPPRTCAAILPSVSSPTSRRGRAPRAGLTVPVLSLAP